MAGNRSEEFNVIEELRSNLSMLDQNTFLPKDDIIKTILENCKRLLILKGYRVIDPIDGVVEVDYKTKKIDDVADYFYILMDYKYGTFMAPHRNTAKERSITREFIKARMESGGISRQTAIRECLLIIRTFFDNIEAFKLNCPPHYGLFGQDKLGWITAVAVDLLNKKKEEQDKLNLERRVDILSDTYSDNWKGFDLDKILKNIGD